MGFSSNSSFVDLVGAENSVIEFHCYTERSDIEALAPRWVDIENRSSENFTFFQSCDWCLNWLKNFSETELNGRKIVPKVYTLEQAGKILLLWPLMETRSKLGSLNLTVMSDPISQYSNLLVDETKVSVELGKQFIQMVKKISDTHTLGIAFYPKKSFLAKISNDFGYSDGSGFESKILDLTRFDNWENYHSSLPKSQRKERNRRRNKLEKLGGLSYKVVSSDEAEFEPLVLKCLELKDQWLESVGKKNIMLARDETRRFLSQYSKFDNKFERSDGNAFVHALMVNDEPIALELGYLFKGDYYSFLGAINLEWENYSPGKVQIEFAQKWAKENNFEMFDFLNDPSTYKTSWTNSVEELQTRFIPLSRRGVVYSRVWKLGVRPRVLKFYKKSGGSIKSIVAKIYRSK